MKKKIAFIINSLEVGGAERFFLELLNHLDREHFEPYLICVFRKGELAEELASDIPLYVIGKKTKLGILAIWKIYRILRQIRPDIVHTVLFGGDLWGRIAAVLARVPKMISTEQNLHTTDRWIERTSKWALNYFTDRVVFISQAVRDDYQKHVPISDNKTKIIPNGANLSRYFRERRDCNTTNIEIIVVARLVPQKGHEFLIPALAMIRNTSWICQLIGDGELEKQLKEKVRGFGLEDRVHFLGTRNDVAELLTQADISILPSVFEGQGIALLESAAAGCFIIASNVDGISEIFADGKTAHLVPPRDPEAIARSILWFMKHKDHAMEIASEAQRMVWSRFDIMRISKIYEDEYNNL